MQHEPALLGKEMEKKIMMTTTLRIALILVSLGTFAMIMRKIRQSRMQIESAIFWLVLALVLVRRPSWNLCDNQLFVSVRNLCADPEGVLYEHPHFPAGK